MKQMLFLNIVSFMLEFGLVSLPTIIANTDVNSQSSTNTCSIDQSSLENASVGDMAVDFISGKVSHRSAGFTKIHKIIGYILRKLEKEIVFLMIFDNQSGWLGSCFACRVWPANQFATIKKRRKLLPVDFRGDFWAVTKNKGKDCLIRHLHISHNTPFLPPTPNVA